jgi:methanogenic corrinoid protein MtbC1
MSDILEELRQSILTYNAERAEELAKRVVEEKIDPLKAFDAMTKAINEIGEGFRKGALWLPDLVGGADAMLRAAPLMEQEIKKRGVKRQSLGVIVAGTVFGDIHSIGKTMVCTLLSAEGFEVHDIGINVQANEFIRAIKEHSAGILVMSALMTTTAPEMNKVVLHLKEEGLRDKVKIMVGGGAITEEFAEKMGADGYDPTAPGAVTVAKSLLRLSHK